MKKLRRNELIGKCFQTTNHSMYKVTKLSDCKEDGFIQVNSVFLYCNEKKDVIINNTHTEILIEEDIFEHIRSYQIPQNVFDAFLEKAVNTIKNL